MKNFRKFLKLRRFLAVMICLCMVIPLFSETGTVTTAYMDGDVNTEAAPRVMTRAGADAASRAGEPELAAERKNSGQAEPATGRKRNAQTEPESGTEPVTERESDTEPGNAVESESGTEPVTERENDTEPGNAAEPESGTEPVTERESDTEPGSAAEPEPGTEPVTERESATDSGNAAESEPGTEPAAEPESDTESDTEPERPNEGTLLSAEGLDALVEEGITLSLLRERTPIALLSENIEPEYFSASVTSIEGATASGTANKVTRKYVALDALKAAFPGKLHMQEDWPGPSSGSQSQQFETEYPQIDAYRISGITVNDTNVVRIGKVSVKTTDGAPQTYVYYSSQAQADAMSSVVLPVGTKIQINYEPQEYGVSYEVYVDGVIQPEADRVFGSRAIFGVRRPSATTDQWFSLDVTIPAGYYGRIYLAGQDGETELFPLESGYGSFPLGKDVKWITKIDSGNGAHRGGMVDTSCQDAPGFFSLSGTYRSGAPGGIHSDQVVRLKVTKRGKEDSAFDASYFLDPETGNKQNSTKLQGGYVRQVENLAAAASWNSDGTAFDYTWSFTTKRGDANYELRSMSVNGTDLQIPSITNPDRGNFNSASPDSASAVTQLPYGMTVTVTVTAVDLGSGSDSARYQRRYDIAVSNAARDVYLTYGTLINSSASYREIVVTKLTGVDLEMWLRLNPTDQNYFQWQKVGQSQSFRVGKENNFAYLITNKSPSSEYSSGGYHQAEEGDPHTGNVRFRLKKGFEWPDGDGRPNITFINKLGGEGQDFTSSVHGPAEDGFCYVKLESQEISGVSSIVHLGIAAVPKQYEVHYLDGTGAPINPGLEENASIVGMPSFADPDQDGQMMAFDTNRGHFYEMADANSSGGEASSKITIFGRAPRISGDQPARFVGWVLTDSEGNPLDRNGQRLPIAAKTGHAGEQTAVSYVMFAPTDVADLETVMAGAVKAPGTGRYPVYLTALWELPSSSFSYYITFNRKNPDGTESLGFVGDISYNNRYAVARREAYTEGAIDVVLETEDSAISAWLKEPENQWYRFDGEKNGSEGHAGEYYWTGISRDNNEVPVWFISSLGQLTVSKTVNGRDPTPDAVFPMTVTFTLPGTDDPGTQGDETRFFGDDGTCAVSYELMDQSGQGQSAPDPMTLSAEGGAYTGTFTLKAGQKAVFDLPGGTRFTVREELDEAHYMLAEGSRDSYAGTVAAASRVDSADFVNVPTGIDVVKTQRIRGSGDFTKDRLEGGTGILIDYQITVTNRNAGKAVRVSLEDEVPGPAIEGSHADEEHRKMRVLTDTIHDGGQLTGGGPVLGAPGSLREGGTIQWPERELQAGASHEYTFTAVCPVVLHEHDYANTAVASYRWSEDAGEGTRVRSNTVAVHIPENWLRVEKIVSPEDPDLTKEFSFSIHLEQSGVGLSASYPYVGRVVEGYGTVPGIAAPENGTLEFTSGEGMISLREGQAITLYGLPVDAAYTVREISEEGFYIDANEYTGTISASSQNWETFRNVRLGQLQLTKEVQGEGAPPDAAFPLSVSFALPDAAKHYFGTDTYSVTYAKDDGEEVLTLEPDAGRYQGILYLKRDETARFTLPEGTEYAVTEGSLEELNQECDAGYFLAETIINGEGTVSAGTRAEVTAHNRFLLPGGLIVRKKVAAGGNTQHSFTIYVRLDDRTVNGTYGAMEFKNGLAVLTLRDTESATASGLPAGMGYTVSELPADGYVAEYSPGQSGTVPTGRSAAVTVTNTYAGGNLQVSKTVTGENADLQREFSFTVQLEEPINGPRSTPQNGREAPVFQDGVASFTLKHGERILFQGLPAGVRYTVAETDYGAEGYVTTSTGAQASISIGETAEASFTNSYQPGSLIVSKSVAGKGADGEKEFSFTVTLMNYPKCNHKHGEMVFHDGVCTFRLKGAQSITAEELHEGTRYEVVEAEADQGGYATESAGASGMISKESGNAATAAFINRYKTGNLKVEKEVTGEGADPTMAFDFTVTLDTELSGSYGDMVFDEGKASFSLQGGAAITARDLPDGTTYTVREELSGKHGYTTENPEQTGTIADRTTAMAVFHNVYRTGSLKITKEVTEGGNTQHRFPIRVKLEDESFGGKYGELIFINGIASVELKDGETKTASGLPAGMRYTISEAAANGYEAAYSPGQSGTIPAEGIAEVTVINTYAGGSLQVSKAVTGAGADVEKEFSFIVELDQAIQGPRSDPQGDKGAPVFEDGRARFTLKHGQRILFKGLPAGAEYTVTEEEEGAELYEMTAEGASGTISSGETIQASFTNRFKTGGLRVSKTVTGVGADPDKAFRFTVTLESEVTGTYGEAELKDGTASFELKSGETRMIENLPAGTTYTVREDDINMSGYQTVQAEFTGKVSDRETARADFTNVYHTGGLTVTKKVTDGGNRERFFTIYVQLDDKTVDGVYGGMTFAKGRAVLTLKDNESVSASGLPAGIGYTVTEQGIQGYTTSIVPSSGSIPSGGRTAVMVTNSYDAGSLTVTKHVEGAGVAEAGKRAYHFTVELNDSTVHGPRGAVSFEGGRAEFTLSGGERMEIPGLPAGAEYSVTEEDAGTDGFITTSEGAHGTIPHGASATAAFTNTYRPGTLAVAKNVTGKGADPEEKFTFTVTLTNYPDCDHTHGDMTFHDGVCTFQLQDGQSMTAADLPEGTVYEVEEVETDSSYAVENKVKSGKILKEKGNAATVTFTNRYKTGELRVEKQVTGLGADPTTSFPFTVTLDRDLTGSYGGMDFQDGVAAFSLRAGESKIALGLPAETGYTVHEELSGLYGYPDAPADQSGTIRYQEPAVAMFTNHYRTGDLEIAKEVTVGGNTQRDFYIIVDLDDRSFGGKYGDLTFAGGSAVTALKAGQHKTANGLPAGMGYTVSERWADGYETTYSNEKGTIPADSTARATVINTYTGGSLQVSKSVKGAGSDPEKEFQFTLLLSEPINGSRSVPQEGREAPVFQDGAANFVLKHGETILFQGLPAGAAYTVSEAEANQDGYITTVTGDTGRIPADSTATVSFLNEKSGYPEEPEDPLETEEPGDPLETEEPEKPGETEEPEEPGETEKPAETEEPEEPGETEKPAETEEPEEPGETEKPAETEEPEEPGETEEPEEPGETEKPEKPGETEEPGETEKPAETEEPAESEKPTEPEEPIEPEEPSESEKPVEPEEPSEPEKPAESEEPIETEKPAEPEKPAESEKPIESEKPAETEKPVESEETIEPEEPVETEAPSETAGPRETEVSRETEESGETEKSEKTAAKTGDSTPVGIVLLLMMATFCILSGALIRRMRRGI